MPLRSSTGLVVLAALLAASGTSAQGGLNATPNPYDNEAAAPLVLRNETAGPVTLDSFQVASNYIQEPYRGGVGFYYRAYFSGVEEQGDVYCYSIRVGEPWLGCQGGLAGRTLAPADSVVIPGFGRYCEICRGKTGDQGPDTLRVYSGGSALPLHVEILNVQFVASEAAEAGGFSLTLSPNPAGDVSTLTLSLPESGSARVAAYDALGREVAVLHDGPAAGTLRLPVDTSAWPVGVYVVRAEAGEGGVSARLVVAR